MSSRTLLMADGYPMFMLRFDKKEEYSKQLRSGKLRFTRISKYRDLPEGDEGRLDRHEGLAASLDGSRICIYIGRQSDKEPIIIADAKRVTVHYNLDDAKVLCLTLPGRESFRKADQNTFRLSMNRKVKALGEWVTVIHKVRKFLDRLDEWGKRHGHRFQLQPVEYISRDGHHLPAKNIGFRKFDDYSWQLEARILVRGLNPNEELTTIDVGDLSDYATILHRTELPTIKVMVLPNTKPRLSRRRNRHRPGWQALGGHPKPAIRGPDPTFAPRAPR